MLRAVGKSKARTEEKQGGESGNAIQCTLAREALRSKVMFGQGLEGTKGVSPLASRRKSTSGGGDGGMTSWSRDSAGGNGETAWRPAGFHWESWGCEGGGRGEEEEEEDWVVKSCCSEGVGSHFSAGSGALTRSDLDF